MTGKRFLKCWFANKTHFGFYRSSNISVGVSKSKDSLKLKQFDVFESSSASIFVQILTLMASIIVFFLQDFLPI